MTRSLSGQRKKYTPPAGDGRVGDIELACGHTATGEPTVTQPSTGLKAWLCGEGCGFQAARKGRRAL